MLCGLGFLSAIVVSFLDVYGVRQLGDTENLKTESKKVVSFPFSATVIVQIFAGYLRSQILRLVISANLTLLHSEWPKLYGVN